jgi:CubicO group peptidase (beta-lactamase class C family)
MRVSQWFGLFNFVTASTIKRTGLGLLLLGCLWSISIARSASIPPASPESAGMSSQRLEQMDKAIQAEIDSGNVAGMVVAISRHGRLVHNRAYGYADVEKGVEMRTNHIFRLYSMTKPVASVALLTLYEKGHFHLSDPLDKYIPEFANLKVYAGKDEQGNVKLEDMKRKPTIQDAFRHTPGLSSGLGRRDVDQLYRDAGLLHSQLESLAEEIQKLGTVPLAYQPGEQWLYGLGHDVQAYLVEVFSGMRFDEYCKKAIFEPLGMNDTMFGVPAELKDSFATTYRPGENGSPMVPDNEDSYSRYTTRPFATISLSSSTEDYMAFAQMLLNGGELNGARVLGKKTVELMSQNHLPAGIAGIAVRDGVPATGYGLGVSVTLNTSALARLGSVGSFGWGGAATTIFSIDPEEDMAYVVMAQKMPNDTSLLNKVENLIYQAIIE